MSRILTTPEFVQVQQGLHDAWTAYIGLLKEHGFCSRQYGHDFENRLKKAYDKWDHLDQEIQGQVTGENEQLNTTLDQVVRTFPDEFGLRAFPGRRFRIDTWSSFSCPDNGFQLVTQIWSRLQGGWLDFSRGSVEELRRECTEPGE